MRDKQSSESRAERMRPTSRRAALRALAASGGAAAIGALLGGCNEGGRGRASATEQRIGSFPSASWKFVFINHVTTNSFFVPTRNGLADAAALLGLPVPQWTGSQNGNVSEMVNAFDTAINAKADGIAVALTDDNAFIEPTKKALSRGIPVLAYNATAPNNYPLTYVGQDLYMSGLRMGRRIAQHVTSGTILVGISQPGGNNVQPRLDGIIAALKQAAPAVKVLSIDTGAEQAGELNAMTAAYSGHPDAGGIYAVDAGSTAAIAQLLTSRGLAGKVHAGGFDLLEDTVKGIVSGALEFTIDQSAYLQGLLPVVYMFLFRLSGTLVSPPVTDTGLTFVTKDNVGPYASADSKFEGGTKQDAIPMPSAIPLPPATISAR